MFDPFLVGMGVVLAEKVEAFTGADASLVNPMVAGMAQQMDLTYNEVVVMLRAQATANMGDGPGSEPPFSQTIATLALLDVAVASPGEAAALLSDHDLFSELDTALSGNRPTGDGKLALSDVESVLAQPERFSRRAVRVAEYLADNPDRFAVLETTNEGTFLRGLAEGKPHVSGLDGLLSYADVTQYAANQWLFDTLRTDLEALTADNGQLLGRDVFAARLDDLDVPNDVRAALHYAIDNGLADGGDERPRWQQLGGSWWRISTLLPGTPTNLTRLLTDPSGLLHDQLAMLRGAGGAIVGMGQFVYDISATGKTGPFYQIESWRVGGDLQRHRGLRLLQSLPGMADAAESLVPGTTEWDQAMEASRYYGTYNVHPGLNLLSGAANVDTLINDPAAWFGALLPDITITSLTGGGGAIERTITTARLLNTAARRLLLRLSETGLQATLRHGLDLAVGSLQALPTTLHTISELAETLTDLDPRLRRYAEMIESSHAELTATHDIVGMYGSTSRSSLEAAAAGGGPTTRVVTNLDSAPQLGRALSVATGDTEALAAAARPRGITYEAEIPNALLRQMEEIGLAQQTTTMMDGVIGVEIRFLPEASEYIVPFFGSAP